MATGIIYSDIGTSPLYVLNGIWPSSGGVPSKEDIIGGVSAIVWSLTLLPLIKYVSFLQYVRKIAINRRSGLYQSVVWNWRRSVLWLLCVVLELMLCRRGWAV